ncbi:signal peptide peptidase SppA [Desulfoluna spongiiphila]|uniref:signal peptide peptidase SppA n=1 Tax=Desulfoluna spongiiphila TaxID=419481 RepID=UPI001255F1EC|nr:signal peptide peptidase SppA [Desulfoluna spongiiphila]VVS94856.1 peptidase s49 sppa [Desulfoluna spongiiphila]
MFSRRHPILFFVLMLTGMFSATVVVISVGVMVSLSPEAPVLENGVGVVEITGVIADSQQVLDDLKYFRETDEVKAIVLRVNSPGGGVGPSQEIYRSLMKTREVKPVITSMGGVAASGGYYAAAATNGIVANSGTITGSIGVIMGYTNFRQILDKIGLEPVVFKSGDMKDAGSPTRDMTDKERDYLQQLVTSLHGQFVRDVATARGLEVPDVAKLADGRIYTGEEAMSLRLVDRLGNLEDALEWAAELGGLEGEPEPIYPPRPKDNMIDYLLDNATVRISTALQSSEMGPSFLYRMGQ